MQLKGSILQNNTYITLLSRIVITFAFFSASFTSAAAPISLTYGYTNSGVNNITGYKIDFQSLSASYAGFLEPSAIGGKVNLGFLSPDFILNDLGTYISSGSYSVNGKRSKSETTERNYEISSDDFTLSFDSQWNDFHQYASDFVAKPDSGIRFNIQQFLTQYEQYFENTYSIIITATKYTNYYHDEETNDSQSGLLVQRQRIYRLSDTIEFDTRFTYTDYTALPDLSIAELLRYLSSSSSRPYYSRSYFESDVSKTFAGGQRVSVDGFVDAQQIVAELTLVNSPNTAVMMLISAFALLVFGRRKNR